MIIQLIPMNRYFPLTCLAIVCCFCQPASQNQRIELDQVTFNKNFKTSFIQHFANYHIIRKAIQPTETYVLSNQRGTSEALLQVGRIKSGKGMFKGLEIRIGLLDYNNNGKFNDVGVDKVLLDYNNASDSMYTHPGKYAQSYQEPFYFGIDDTDFFQLKEIAPTGNFITVLPASPPAKEVTLQIYTKAFEAPIKLANGTVSNLKSLFADGKPLYVWNVTTNCRGCTKQLNTVRQWLRESGHKLRFMQVFHDRSPQKVKAYTAKHDISWPTALGSEALTKKLDVVSFPSGTLFNSEGKITQNKISLKKLIQLF